MRTTGAAVVSAMMLGALEIACSSQEDVPRSVRLEARTANGDWIVRLINDTEEDFSYLRAAPAAQGALRPLIYFRTMRPDGTILSENDFLANGWWTPLVYSSTAYSSIEFLPHSVPAGSQLRDRWPASEFGLPLVLPREVRDAIATEDVLCVQLKFNAFTVLPPQELAAVDVVSDIVCLPSANQSQRIGPG